MVNQIVVGIMMAFMVLGAVDQAIFQNKFGYGEEFIKGLNTMGPLTLTMAGIMCIAPVLGKILIPVFKPLLSLIGADPGMVGGMFLAVDMGGFPLVQQMSESEDTILLSGILLGATLGAAICFTIPVGLSMMKAENRPFAIKGIVAGIIASPICPLAGGLAWGIPIKVILVNLIPAFVMALILAFLLLKVQKPTLKFFLGFAKVLSALGILWLAAAIIEELLGFTVIPGMADLGEQLKLIGTISITLAGAYPMVKMIQKVLSPALKKLASLLKIDETSACGMLVCLANPLPMFEMVDSMGKRGIVLCFAFATPILALIGDHLGYVSASYAEGITPMLIGKTAAGLMSLLFGLLLERTGKNTVE